jgi:hypothetical protein
MTSGEARRLDLYNALSETIGAERAETLMAYLPSREAGALATHGDVAMLGTHVNRLEVRLDRVEARFDRLEAKMNERFDAVNQRLDRLFLTLAAGLIAMIATVFAQAIL